MSEPISRLLLPRFQRLLQFHAARSFQQYNITISRLAREPLAGFFRSGDELRVQSRFLSRLHHRLGQSSHTEQEVNFTSAISGNISCDVASAVTMQLLASYTE